jgi:hypothetical protein
MQPSPTYSGVRVEVNLQNERVERRVQQNVHAHDLVERSAVCADAVALESIVHVCLDRDNRQHNGGFDPATRVAARVSGFQTRAPWDVLSTEAEETVYHSPAHHFFERMAF